MNSSWQFSWDSFDQFKRVPIRLRPGSLHCSPTWANIYPWQQVSEEIWHPRIDGHPIRLQELSKSEFTDVANSNLLFCSIRFKEVWFVSTSIETLKNTYHTLLRWHFPLDSFEQFEHVPYVIAHFTFVFFCYDISVFCFIAIAVAGIDSNVRL